MILSSSVAGTRVFFSAVAVDSAPMHTPTHNWLYAAMVNRSSPEVFKTVHGECCSGTVPDALSDARAKALTESVT